MDTHEIRDHLTVKELDTLQHALGLDASRKPYRNHYVAGGRDLEVCRGLVLKGLMEEGRSTYNAGPCFHVTELGQKIAVIRR